MKLVPWCLIGYRALGSATPEDRPRPCNDIPWQDGMIIRNLSILVN